MLNSSEIVHLEVNEIKNLVWSSKYEELFESAKLENSNSIQMVNISISRTLF